MTPCLIEDLKRDEGLRLNAYRDTRDIWTIGYGHAGIAPGTVWTPARAEAQLAADIAGKVADLNAALPWWRSLDDVRQDVLVELCFNLGIGGLLGFCNTLSRIRAGDYAMASAGMLASRWAGQVGRRATRLAAMMKTGARAAPTDLAQTLRPQPERNDR